MFYHQMAAIKFTEHETYVGGGKLKDPTMYV